MSCNPDVLKHVPLFALLDEDETAVLAGQVELKNFAPRQQRLSERFMPAKSVQSSLVEVAST